MQVISDLLRKQFRELDSAEDKAAFIELARSTLHDLAPNKAQPVDLVQWVPIDKVRSNSYNPNSVAESEMRLLYTSIDKDGYCVEESTPILTADMTWVSAGSLAVGDKLIAFDEFATGNGKGRKQRRYRTAEVLANSVEASDLVQVRTSRGTLTVTPDHPFLTKRCYGRGFHLAEWIAASDLRPDDLVIYLMKPWMVDRSWEAGWLAGFLDGEGTLANNQNSGRSKQTVRLSGYQRPGPTSDQMIAEMTKRATVKVFTVDRSDHPRWNDMVMVRIDRLTEIMRLLGSVRPSRLLASGGSFWEGCALSSALKGESQAIVLDVTPAAPGSIARLVTSTRTYIANGFAAHNTQPIVACYNAEEDTYEVVDGFHRYFVMKSNPDIYDRCHGLLPVVVIDKDVNDRMASTVRHNRARGKHSVTGMSNLVFNMLNNGWDDVSICNELGMEPEELLRLKHITGFSKLFADVEYSRSWMTKNQVLLKKKIESENLEKVENNHG
jgi:hypothetical protein